MYPNGLRSVAWDVLASSIILPYSANLHSFTSQEVGPPQDQPHHEPKSLSTIAFQESANCQPTRHLRKDERQENLAYNVHHPLSH